MISELAEILKSLCCDGYYCDLVAGFRSRGLQLYDCVGHHLHLYHYCKEGGKTSVRITSLAAVIVRSI